MEAYSLHRNGNSPGSGDWRWFDCTREPTLQSCRKDQRQLIHCGRGQGAEDTVRYEPVEPGYRAERPLTSVTCTVRKPCLYPLQRQLILDCKDLTKLRLPYRPYFIQPAVITLSADSQPYGVSRAQSRPWLSSHLVLIKCTGCTYGQYRVSGNRPPALTVFVRGWWSLVIARPSVRAARGIRKAVGVAL